MKSARLSLVVLFAIVVIGTVFYGHAALTISNAKIWTDKPDYSPGSLVTIYGIGFDHNAIVDLTVLNPDNSSVSWQALSNSTGAFETSYELTVVGRNYYVMATDGTNVAYTSFTDLMPAFVRQTAGASSSGSTSLSCTYGASPAQNNLLIVSFSWHPTTVTISSVSDTLGNSWTDAGAVAQTQCRL